MSVCLLSFGITLKLKEMKCVVQKKKVQVTVSNYVNKSTDFNMGQVEDWCRKCTESVQKRYKTKVHADRRESGCKSYYQEYGPKGTIQTQDSNVLKGK